MKILLTFLVAVTIGFSMQAQNPAPPDSEAIALEAIKASNDALLKKQAATVVTLEELKKMAQQLKIFSRRA